MIVKEKTAKLQTALEIVEQLTLEEKEMLFQIAYSSFIQQQQALEEQQELESRLAAYETQYQMSSGEFYRRFRLGELGDTMDFVEWSVFYEMH